MAGSVKLDCYDAFKNLVTSEVKTADFCTAGVSALGANDGVVKVKYSAYDGTTGVVKIQVSSDNTSIDADWVDWGGTNAQGVMNASGVCEFHVWQFGPTYIRACVTIGDGTTVTLDSIDYRLGFG